MYSPTLIQLLRQRFTLPLPGEPAQMKMAPHSRLTMKEYAELANSNARKSAVLICLMPQELSIHTLFILRPNEQGAHSGQISFPGGRYEEQDADLQATALREAYEEVGIDPVSVLVLGAMTPLYIPVSDHIVQPYLAVLPAKPILRRNAQEVQEIIAADIQFLFNHTLKQQGTFSGFNHVNIEAPYYQVSGHRVWGATAMMLSELEQLLKEVLE